MKKTLISILVVMAALTALVFSLKLDKRGTPAPVGQQPTETPSAYMITREPTMVSVAEDSYLLGIGGSYPQFPQADAAFNAKIAKMVTDEITTFKKSANDDYQTRLQTGGDEFRKEFEQGGMYTMNVKMELVQSNDRYISFVIRIEGYTGGAHGYHTITSFNYDVAAKRELAITDFITLADASAQSREQLKKVFADNSDAATFESFAMDGTDPKKPENFANFTFTNDAVKIYFNEYQVAPYVYGEQSTTIQRK